MTDILQRTEVIQTHLGVVLQDEHVADYTLIDGTADLNLELLYSYPISSSPYDYEQGYWGYRGQAALVHDNSGSSTGPIYRVRIGDGSSSNRQIYSQTITDPIGTPSQWTSWSSLYTGDHYALDCYYSAGLKVVHAKSDGLYYNNTLKISLTGIIRVHCVVGKPGAVYFIRVIQDSDGNRTMNTYYVADITAGSPTAVFDKINYRWPRQEMVAFKFSSGGNDFIHRIRGLAYSAPSVRADGVSDDLIQEYIGESSVTSDLGSIYPMRGAAGRAGVRFFQRMWVSGYQAFPRDKTYLFYTERHTDRYQNPLSNLHCPVFCMMTGYPLDGWTEPQPLGFSLWGLAGAAYWGNYVIIAGNGSAYYKLADTTETDLSNYAVEAELNLPRGTEKATGELSLANPDDVVGQAIGMLPDQLSTAPQKRVKVTIGQLRSLEDGWEDAEINDWWISEAHRISDDNKKRIGLRLGDFWQRLEVPFKDPYYFPGHLEAEDWQFGGDQIVDNWYPIAGEMSTVSDTDADDNTFLKLEVTKDWVTYTKWKGAHCRVSVQFDLPSAGPVIVGFRWVDKKNHWRVQYINATLRLQQVIDGTATTLDSVAVTAGQTVFNITVKARFGWITYSLGGTSSTYQETGTARDDQYGFVALYSKVANTQYSSFDFRDYDAPITTSSLIKFLLIYAGYFQFNVAENLRDINQLSILWGPQTDLISPAKALERLLEGNQQDVLWQSASTADGRGEIVINQFTDTDPLYDIDDEIISVDQADVSELRPNTIEVDGNEDSWTEYSKTDIYRRGAVVAKYLDMPELLSLTDVKNKAQEEKTLASKGNSLGGLCIWRPWFHKMDAVSWTDHEGNYYTARIEGMVVTVNQSTTPFQHAELDLTPITVCDPETDDTGGTGGSGSGGEILDPGEFIAQDDWDRDDASSTWGDAVTGGTWSLTGTASNFSIASLLGKMSTSAASSDRIARLTSISENGPLYLKCQINFGVLSGENYTKAGILARVIDTSNFYRICIGVQYSPGGKAFFQIYKNVGGTGTQLASVQGFNVYSGMKVNVRVWIRGTSPTYISIRWWLDGEPEPDTWMLETQDSQAALQAAGAVGLWYINTSGNTTTTIVYFDDFEVSEAPAS